MAKMSGQEFAEKWARRTSQAVPDYVQGVNRTEVAPGVLAAKQKDKMKAKINLAIDSGKWGRNVAAVPLSDWQRAATEKGAQRIGAGVSEATNKQAEFGEKLMRVVDAGQAKIANMPSTSLEENISRMTAFIRHMAENPIKG